MPLIDVEQCRRVAEVLKDVRIPVDSFTDPDYYPPRDDDPEMIARYFMVMVAMDHRLSRPGRPYEAVIDGRLFHGADLLYRLGMLMYERDPEFFAPERLSKVTVEDVRRWLCVGEVCPPDPELRAALLRDLGRKLIALYRGSVLEIVDRAGGRLYGNPVEPGFVDLLRVFHAYSDPVDKKAMLLAKFLERRGLLKVRDVWEKRVPVDNHVTRIALRLGIVVLEDHLRAKLVRGEPFTAWEDVVVRIAVREAWWLVARMANIDPFILDDALWTMGRRVCVHGRPLCGECEGHPLCVRGSCVFRLVCPTGLGLREPVEEHNFLETWWY